MHTLSWIPLLFIYLAVCGGIGYGISINHSHPICQWLWVVKTCGEHTYSPLAMPPPEFAITTPFTNNYASLHVICNHSGTRTKNAPRGITSAPMNSQGLGTPPGKLAVIQPPDDASNTPNHPRRRWLRPKCPGLRTCGMNGWLSREVIHWAIASIQGPWIVGFCWRYKSMRGYTWCDAATTLMPDCQCPFALNLRVQDADFDLILSCSRYIGTKSVDRHWAGFMHSLGSPLIQTQSNVWLWARVESREGNLVFSETWLGNI